MYSEPGKGTTFKICPPRVDEAVDEHDDAVLPQASPKRSDTILLVEDEDQVRNILQQMLQEQGYRVLTASGGDGALRIAAVSKIILI